MEGGSRGARIYSAFLNEFMALIAYISSHLSKQHDVVTTVPPEWATITQFTQTRAGFQLMADFAFVKIIQTSRRERVSKELRPKL